MLFSSHWLEDSLDILEHLPPRSVLGISNILDDDCLGLSDEYRERISLAARCNKIAFANLEPRFYPAEAFKEIGLLDENFKQSEAEDVDFNIRLHTSGFNITATNLVNCFHGLGFTRLKLLNNEHYRSRNLEIAYARYGKDKFDKFNAAVRDVFYVDGIPFTRYGC